MKRFKTTNRSTDQTKKWQISVTADANWSSLTAENVGVWGHDPILKHMRSARGSGVMFILRVSTHTLTILMIITSHFIRAHSTAWLYYLKLRAVCLATLVGRPSVCMCHDFKILSLQAPSVVCLNDYWKCGVAVFDYSLTQKYCIHNAPLFRSDVF